MEKDNKTVKIVILVIVGLGAYFLVNYLMSGSIL